MSRVRKFWLNELEDQRYREWAETHQEECPIPPQDPFKFFTVTSPHTFKFTPTGIGDGIVIECRCGASVDVTDTDSW